MTKPTLAYLAIVTLGVWVWLMVRELGQTGDLLRAPVVAAGALLMFGPGGLAFVIVLLLPAMVVAIELVHRFEARSRVARSVIGAASWAGWCLFLAVTLAGASRLVVTPGDLAGYVVLFAGAGAGFSLLAFGGYETRAGIALTLSALAVTALVILGSFWMAGRWGGAA